MATPGSPEVMVKEFCSTQRGLVTKLFATVQVFDREYFKDLPDGCMSYEGEMWSYRRHGAGVAFRSTRGVVVDAHVAMANWPGAVDAWRLYLYFESIGVQEMRCDGRVFAVDGEKSMRQLLKHMEASGVVRTVKDGRISERNLYVPVTD